MTDKLTNHHVTAELISDKQGDAIMLTQQETELEEPDIVLLHPSQLRQVCEHFGIIARDREAEKTIATLQRRLIALRDRIVQLDYWLAHHSDHKHADLSHELVSVGALSDLANEWCAEFEKVEPDSTFTGEQLNLNV